MGFCLHNLYEVLKVSVTVFLLCHKGYTAAEQCLNASDEPNKLSCTFDVGFCGWSNTADGDFDWKRDISLLRGHYIAAEGGSAGSRTVLESPSVCSTGDNMLQLQFGYYMGLDASRCQLTASVKTEFGIENIVTLRNHRGSGFNYVGPFRIFCQTVSFKIIFQATKMTSVWCGALLPGVYIDDIKVDLVDGTSTTFTCPTNAKHPPSAVTTSTPVITSRVGSTSLSTGTTSEVSPSLIYSTPNVTASIAGAFEPSAPDDGGLSGGAVAVIALSVLVIVAAIVIVVVVMIWRRKGRYDKSLSSPQYVNTSGGGPSALQPETNIADDPSPLSQIPAPGGNARVSRLPSNLSRGNPAEDNYDYLTPTSESVVSPAASHNYHDTAPDKVYHYSTAADKGYYNVAPPAAAHDIGGKANYSNVPSPTTNTDTDNHVMSHIKDGRVSVSTDDHVSYYNTPDADGYYNASSTRNVITAGQENHYTKLSPVNPDTQDNVYTGLTPETDNATSEESYEKPSPVKPDEHLYTGLRRIKE